MRQVTDPIRCRLTMWRPRTEAEIQTAIDAGTIVETRASQRTEGPGFTGAHPETGAPCRFEPSIAHF